MSWAQDQYNPIPLAPTDPIQLPLPREPFDPHPPTARCGTEALCEFLATLRGLTHRPGSWMVEAAYSQPDDGATGLLGLAVSSG